MNTGLIFMILIFVVLIILDLPIYAALLAATIFLQMVINGQSITNVVTGMYEALTKTSLMAVPFFVFAGSVMGATSLGKRLIDCFEVVLRPFKAGLAISCLAANAFFGAISGSAPAATATFGKVIHEPLKKNYDDSLATGLITSAGALSVIIPPSISIILYAIAAEVSTTKLFLCGIIPGIIIVIIVAIFLIWRCKGKTKSSRASAKEIGRVFKKGIPILILPVLVLGGIYTGVFTPTEAGALAALYSLIVGVFVLRDVKSPKQFFGVLRGATQTTSQIFILVAVSTTFAQAAAMAQLPSVVNALIGDVGKIAFLFLINIVLLIVGCFIDGGCAILILVPIVLPVATAFGIDPLHLGIIFVVNLAIGLFTPPFGLNIFVAQSVLKKNVGEISRALVPYIVCYIIALVLITFVPQISLAILG